MGKMKLLAGSAALLIGVSLSAYASANTVDGMIWLNNSNVGDATIANIPLTAPDVTFTVPSNPLDLDSRNSPGGYTIGGFIASGGGSITSGASHAGDDLDNAFFAFSGMVSVTNGQTFTVAHDDGLQLEIGGLLVIDVPGPTAPDVTTVTYTGPTGNLPFKLAYGECCGAPAVLDINLPLSAAPEPSTWAMMGLGFAALGFAGYRARKTSISIA
jgi:hypothetical protein